MATWDVKAAGGEKLGEVLAPNWLIAERIAAESFVLDGQEIPADADARDLLDTAGLEVEET